MVSSGVRAWVCVGVCVAEQVNRGSSTGNTSVSWEMLEVPGITATTIGCAREQFTGVNVTGTGGVAWTLDSHDIAVLRVTFGAGC
jgi:hypothetical protein